MAYFYFSIFLGVFCKNLYSDLIPCPDLVLNFLLLVVCFLNMPSKQSTSGRVRGKNYNATDDRLLIELVIEHAEELGLYDSLNYAWKTRISHASVRTCFVVDI